jgi:hypothetical protein
MLDISTSCIREYLAQPALAFSHRGRNRSRRTLDSLTYRRDTIVIMAIIEKSYVPRNSKVVCLLLTVASGFMATVS